MSRPTPPLFRRALTLDGVYVAAAVAITLIVPLLSRVAPHDFWWHMAMGRLILHEGRVPTVDTFSFTRAGEPFFNQSWLAQVWMYTLHQMGGLPLLIAVQALFMLAACLALLRAAVRRTGRLRLSVALLLLAIEPNAYTNWSIRPQSYAIPLFVAYLVILTGYRERWWRTLWPLVPLMALWVNLHGTFLMGLVMVALVALGEGIRRGTGDTEALSAAELRRLAGYGAAAALAVLLNPQGPRVIGYVANLLRSKTVTSVVTEWASPSPRDAGGALFFALVLLLFVAMMHARRRPVVTDLLLILPFLWLALSAGRNIVWFAIVAYVPLVEAVALWGDRGRGTGDGGRGTGDEHGRPGHPDGGGAEAPRGAVFRTRPLPLAPRPSEGGVPAANAVILAVLAAAVVLSLPWLRPSLGLPRNLAALTTEDTPIAAVEYLRRMPAGERPRRLFHSTGFGSYLTWALPEQPVFVDPRFEFYPMPQITDYRYLNAGCNVERLLARYRIDGLLLERKAQAELEKEARQRLRWRVLYEDRTAVLMVPARSGRVGTGDG